MPVPPADNAAEQGPLRVDLHQYDPTRILVRFAPDAVASAAQRVHDLLPEARLGSPISADGALYEVSLPAAMSAPAATDLFASQDWVVSAEKNYRIYLDSVTPNDSYFSSLWGLHNAGQTGGTLDADIDAPEAWNITTGSQRVVVAVLDTGVDYTHPDLAANIWANQDEIAADGIDNDNNGYIDDVRGWDFYNWDNNPMDDHGHGTHIAGTIGAVGNNGQGVVGVAWNVQIMPLKIFGANNTGYLSDAANALRYAVANGATISNHSYSGTYSSTLFSAIDAALSAGHLVVASAGNNGKSLDLAPVYPAAFDLANIITVAATDHSDALASWSNVSQTHVDLAAPGVNIHSTMPANSFGYKSGTSMAAPHVTGAAALLQAAHEEWDFTQIKQALLANVDPLASLTDKTVSGGRLNINRALGGAAVGLSVTISPREINEAGGQSTAIVTRQGNLDSPLTVSVASNDTTEATVPATVTIAAGQPSATFTITGVNDTLDDGDITTTITASASGFTNGTDTVVVTDDDVAALTLVITAASFTENGGTSTAAVTRNTSTAAALTVTLTSSETTEATVPATVTIAAGQASATFTITGVNDTLDDGDITTTITASASGFTNGTDTVVVTDDDVAALTLVITAASFTENGGTSTATVTRNTSTAAALTMTLASNDTTEATVPATVTIAAGQASATFTITGVNDTLDDGDISTTITAAATGFANGTDTVVVIDDDVAALTLVITAASFPEKGGTSTATVTRNTSTAAALTVTLASSDTTEATVPATVTIAAGQASATFTITGVNDTMDDGDITTTITAAASGFANGTDTVVVTDDDVAALTLVITAASFREKGGTSTATVTRNTSTAAALTVTLASSDTTEATVPATVTIAAGQASATFTITGVNDTLDDGDITTTITASASGFTNVTDTVVVLDDEISGLALEIEADTISETGSTIATLTRSVRMSTDLVVYLTSSDPTEVTMPKSVVIPARRTSVSFVIAGVHDGQADGDVPVTIKASAGRLISSTDSLVVTDVADRVTLTFDVASISENGGVAQATLTRTTGINSPLTVQVSSSDASEASVLATVTFPAGAASVQFPITGVDDAVVDGDVATTITVDAGDLGSVSADLLIRDDDIPTFVLTVLAASISESGGRTTATLTRNALLDTALAVPLINGDPTEISLPASVTFAVGQLSTVFTVSSVDDYLLDRDITVTIQAVLDGFISGIDTIIVIDDDIPSL